VVHRPGVEFRDEEAVLGFVGRRAEAVAVHLARKRRRYQRSRLEAVHAARQLPNNGTKQREPLEAQRRRGLRPAHISMLGCARATISIIATRCEVFSTCESKSQERCSEF